MRFFIFLSEEPATEESNVTETLEGPGADEEVCLLPDTEREISEADKAEAAKVLAEKRKQAEEGSYFYSNINLN